MVLTETINYHTNHLGAIRTNKDRLKYECNVGIVITKNRFGEYQEVDITGYTKDIKIVKQKLQEIIYIAEYEYKQFRLRYKARRRIQMQKYSSSKLQLPKLQIPLSKKKYSNPFEVLNNLDDDGSSSSLLYDNEYPKLPSGISSSN